MYLFNLEAMLKYDRHMIIVRSVLQEWITNKKSSCNSLMEIKYFTRSRKLMSEKWPVGQTKETNCLRDAVSWTKSAVSS